MVIFASNLSTATTAETLTSLFSQHGTVNSADVVYDRDSGVSKGFAFVDMPNESEGNAAISALNGSELDGNTISVRVAN